MLTLCGAVGNYMKWGVAIGIEFIDELLSSLNEHSLLYTIYYYLSDYLSFYFS